MKLKIIGIALGLLCQIGYGQKKTFPLESFFTENDFHYQHTIYRTLGTGKFAFFNLTSLKTNYKSPNDSNAYLFRNQLFYKIHSNFSIGLTGELKSSGSAARLGLQYIFKNKTVTLSLYPNITIANVSSFVNMLYFEYKPKISKKTNLYTRLQIQTTTAFKGNTKYSNLYRIGIEYKTMKFGIGMSWFDPFNTSNMWNKHLGLFIGVTI